MQKLYLFLFLFSSAAFADNAQFVMDYDMQKHPMHGYSNWCFVNFEKDNWDRGQNQPPHWWYGVRINIPDNATAVQITGRPPKKCLCNEGAEMSLVPRAPTIQGIIGSGASLLIPVSYWGDPFKLFIGWQYPGSGNRGRVSACQAIRIDPDSEVVFFNKPLFE